MNRHADFEAHFATLDLADGAADVGATVVPDQLSKLVHQDRINVIRTLPRLLGVDAPDVSPDLQLLGTLGEGGMGLVRLANQLALDREVAVKTLRNQSLEAAPKLLQEAYVTGKLEHPNIVPVYTLGRDENDAPLIVMKRIEGVSWLEVVRNPEVMPDLQVDLMWHLETLLQLCNALRYAHRHEVIHRDIKPENVMIGAFGEVYLLDWGIAVSIADDPLKHSALPHRSEVKGVSGTPVYMAPEMTADDALEHDTRTDVYLLGATLHEVITGKPPHDAETLFDVMATAFFNVPKEYPATIPSELASIARRAMATKKEDRYQSVDEFRQAILAFIEHRGVIALVDEAEAMLHRIDEKIAAGEDAVDIHDNFIEVRFACEQALRAWPDNANALAVRDRYLVARFSYAITTRDETQARAIAQQMRALGQDTAKVDAQLESLVGALEAERAELDGLRAVAAGLDLNRGRLSRSFAVAAMGIWWSFDTARSWQKIVGTPDYDLPTEYVNATGRVAVIGVIGMFLFRRAIMHSSANRRLALVLLFAMVAIVVCRQAYALSPENVGLARALEICNYGMAATAAGLICDDRRIVLLALMYFPLSIASAHLGPSSTIYLAIVHLVFFLGLAYLWTPKQMARRKPI